MHQMKKATVQDLRYRFYKLEALLREGHTIQITARKHAIAKLVPIKASVPARRPDFLARQRKLFGNKQLKVSNAHLLAWDRDRF